jgi:hypothetical protein
MSSGINGGNVASAAAALAQLIKRRAKELTIDISQKEKTMEAEMNRLKVCAFSDEVHVFGSIANMWREEKKSSGASAGL